MIKTDPRTLGNNMVGLLVPLSPSSPTFWFESPIQTTGFPSKNISPGIDPETTIGIESIFLHPKVEITSYTYVEERNGNAVVEFDITKTNEAEIEIAINTTGYKVISKK